MVLLAEPVLRPLERAELAITSSQQKGGSRNLAEQHCWVGSLVGLPKVSPSWFRSVRAPSRVSSNPWEVSELPGTALSAPVSSLSSGRGGIFEGEAYGKPE